MRALRSEDAGLMLDIWNDPAFVRNVGDRGIRTLDEALEATLAGPVETWNEYGYGPFRVALKDSDTPIGICGFFRRDNLDVPDLGYAILPGYCGKGYAFEAASGVIDYARSDLGFAHLIAIIAPGNVASISLIRKLGFEFERMHMLPGADDAVQLFGMSLNMKE